MMCELVYYVAVTLDGYIAGPDGQFDAFLIEGDHMDGINADWADTVPTHLADALGIDQSGGRFGTVLMGANTYAVGLPDVMSPYRHLEQYVVTSRPYLDQENLTVTEEDPVRLVRRLKAERERDIWLCGGGRLAGQLAGEIDRLVLKRQPIVFGSGIPLFGGGGYRPRQFDLVSSTDFRSGVTIREFVPHSAAG